VKHINAKGGLNGHPIQFLVYDDGGDAGRGQAQAREAIEQRHVIAFLQMSQAIVGASNVEYITSKRVPVIGLVLNEYWAYTSPMYFPQASTGDAYLRIPPAASAKAMVPKGKTRFGVLGCVESETCGAQTQQMFAEGAQRYGYQLVFQARTSIAQPDFTSECLAARKEDVQFLFVSMDQNSVRRVSAACARQGFRPVLGMHAGVPDEKFKDEDLLDFIATTAVFPWFQSGTPATDEFQQALEAYGKGLTVTGILPLGWTSGKLLEKAAARLPEPPTSAAILAGLWSLKGDTLDGLTMPLTFTEDEPAKPQVCYFNIAVRDRSWVSPDGFTRHCVEDH
jgi:branched-chain amino acid transport system substrate-binding protein